VKRQVLILPEGAVALDHVNCQADPGNSQRVILPIGVQAIDGIAYKHRAAASGRFGAWQGFGLHGGGQPINPGTPRLCRGSHGLTFPGIHHSSCQHAFCRFAPH